MYNTGFKVKYNDIEQELINKLKNKTSEEYKENTDNEHEYSSQDVLDICNKLYRDELLSVFGAKDLMDDKIDKGINYVYDIIITNEAFKQIINEIEKLYNDEFYKNEELNFEKQDCVKQLVLISLFSQYLFHITHKCICQLIELGTIDDALLVEFRQLSVELLKKQFIV
jgi:hypothetical protein